MWCLFEQALAELSGLPLGRVRGLVHDNGGAGFRAIYDKAGLPASAWPAFRSAIEAMREASHAEPGGASRLKRRMIERVLTGCQDAEIGEVEAFAHPVAPLRDRGRARGSAPLLRRAGGRRRDDIRRRAGPRRGLTASRRRSKRGQRSDAIDGLGTPSSGSISAPSWRRNSSLTSRRRLVSVSAINSALGVAVLADDGAHRIDVLIDQRKRNATMIVRELEQPAQTVGDRGGERKAQRRGLALDVMAGAEQRLALLHRQPVLPNVGARLVELLAFVVHPAAEFGGQLRQAASARATGSSAAAVRVHAALSLLGGVITWWSAKLATFGLSPSAFVMGVFPPQPGILTLSNKACCLMMSASPPLRRSGPT